MSQYSDAVDEQRRARDRREAGYTRRMLKAYDDLLDSLDEDLHQITDQIEEARANGEDVHPDWLRRQARYARLMDQVKLSSDAFVALGTNIIVDASGSEIERGAVDALERSRILFPGEVYFPEGDIFSGNINLPAMENLIGQTSGSSPLMKVLDSHGTGAADIITSGLIAGLSGQGADEIFRNIRRQLQSPVHDSRLMALVRTEMMNSYRASMHEQYDQFGDEIDGWMWSAHRGPRTCLACLAMDGQVFPMDRKFDQAHVNCRCSASPWPKDLYPEVQAFLQQQGSGEDWLRRQSPDVRAKMFPSKDAFDAFERGDLHLMDFVGYTDSPVWGRKIYQVSGREAMKNGGVTPPPKAQKSAPSQNLPASQRIPAGGFTSQADLQQFYRDINVPVYQSGPYDPIVATEVTRALAREFDLGNPMPASITFTDQARGSALAYARANFVDMSQSTLTFINPKMTPEEYKATRFNNELSMELFGVPWSWGTYDTDGIFTHEYAHFLHFQNITNVERRGNQVWYDFDDGKGRTGSAGWDGWNGRGKKKNQETASKVSRYGATMPVEFVAEVYTGFQRGEEFDQDVLDLYDKLGGPELKKEAP